MTEPMSTEMINPKCDECSHHREFHEPIACRSCNCKEFKERKPCANGAVKSGTCAVSAEAAQTAEAASAMSTTETIPVKTNTTEFPEPIPEERAGREATCPAIQALPAVLATQERFDNCRLVVNSLKAELKHWEDKPFYTRNIFENDGEMAGKDWSQVTEDDFRGLFEYSDNCKCQGCSEIRYILELRAQLAAQPSVQRDEVALRKLLESIRDDDSGRDHFRYCRTNVYYPGLKALQDDRCSICEALDSCIEKLRPAITAERGSK